MPGFDSIRNAFDTFEPASIIDILSIAVLIYLALLLLKGTTAMSLLRGIVIVVVGAVIIVQLLELTVLGWLLDNAFPALLIAIPIIFQSEIRRFLERVGRTSRWPWPGRALYEGVVDTLADASLNLAEKRHGAIVVLERETGLEEYIDTGVKLNAECSSPLLLSIFYPNSALHDGAVIVREDRALAASCTLPLSDRLDAGFPGTRHRAALGVTERTDAIAVVVSEETGQISIAANGRMISNLDGPRLRGILRSLLLPSIDLDRPSGRRLPRLSR
ncbi:MAG TPA: diadenylate cyclase CdaA [Dehalococcoidia bacterium]|nr:diadenylate cyclase CdaA [Dehalococcoidia bacterium]